MSQIYNTRVAVVMNIVADNEADAVRRLSSALEWAGFTHMAAEGAEYADAFAAEEGTELSELSGASLRLTVVRK